jgi:hypothetical protein
MELLKENFAAFLDYFQNILENQDRIPKILMGWLACNMIIQRSKGLKRTLSNHSGCSFADDTKAEGSYCTDENVISSVCFLDCLGEGKNLFLKTDIDIEHLV